jgi:hypothetical protein
MYSFGSNYEAEKASEILFYILFMLLLLLLLIIIIIIIIIIITTTTTTTTIISHLYEWYSQIYVWPNMFLGHVMLHLYCSYNL